MNGLEYYNNALNEAAQRERTLADKAKTQGDERAHSIHLMKASMMGDMLKVLGRVVYEGKRPNALINILNSLSDEADKAHAQGDYDTADRAEQKAMTVQFAIDTLEEAKKYGA